MTVRLLINAVPPIEIPEAGRIVSRIRSVGEIRQQLSSETASIAITLDNHDGALWQDFSPPPFGAAATLSDDYGEIISGVITSVRQVGADLEIQLESAGSRSFADPIQLRRTTEWAEYVDDAVIPICYGIGRSKPVRYDAAGRLWIVAGHQMTAIDSVTDDDGLALAHEWRIDVDETGQPVCVVELLRPSETTPIVSWRGKPDPDTGELMQTPAAILYDLVRRVIGYPLARSRLNELDNLTGHFRLGGVIDNDNATARAVVSELCESVGAEWSPNCPTFAVLHPFSVTPVSIETLNRIAGLDVSSRAENISTVLTISYDYDNADNISRRSIRAEAPEAVKKLGKKHKALEFRWIKQPRDAEEIARRILGYSARPEWEISGSISQSVLPGQYVTIYDKDSPYSGQAICVASVAKPGYPGCAITAVAPHGTAPTITITHQASAATPVPIATASVEAIDGASVVTVEVDGRRLSGATVTINGSVQQTTDARGQIRIDGGPGRYELYVEAPGYAPFELVAIQ